MKAAFPSLADRDPTRREQVWREGLQQVAASIEPFDYARARDVHPGKYPADDPRGDRSVIVDPNWCTFVRSPFPERQPLNFVKSDDIVVYQCSRDKRLYAAVPLFTGIAPDSPLGQLAQAHARELFWWQKYADTFTALPLWPDKPLSPRRQLLLVQLETRNPDYVVQMLSGYDGRAPNWSLVTERRRARPRYRSQRQWVLHLATSREVVPEIRPNVLGIHFGVEPIMWWALINDEGRLLKEGKIEQNEILNEGLGRQLRMQEEQGKQRWVGDRRYAKELKRRTTDVAKLIIALAIEHDANLALEKISWVDKRRGGPDLNRRHSMWNFSELPDRITWLGLEHREGDTNAPVVTVTNVSDYELRYTCPRCGACRKAKEKPDNAKTWRTGDILHCRPCGYVGPVADDHQARLVTKKGFIATNNLRARQTL